MTTNLRPLDITKIDYDLQRHQKRMKLFRWSAVPVFGLIAAGIWLILPAVATSQAAGAYDSGRYDVAGSWLNILGTNTIFEPYKRVCNEALVATRHKKFERASDLFRQAILLAPEDKKCFVRLQSVLSSEFAGDDAVARNDQQAAVVYYTKALSDMTTNPHCFKDQGELSKNISKKLTDLISAMKKQKTTNNPASPDTKKPEASEPKEEQLKELERLQRKAQVQTQEDSNTTPTDYTDTTKKKW